MKATSDGETVATVGVLEVKETLTDKLAMRIGIDARNTKLDEAVVTYGTDWLRTVATTVRHGYTGTAAGPLTCCIT